MGEGRGVRSRLRGRSRRDPTATGANTTATTEGDTTQDTTGDTTRDTTEDTTRGTMEDTTRDTIQDTTQDTGKDADRTTTVVEGRSAATEAVLIPSMDNVVDIVTFYK